MSEQEKTQKIVEYRTKRVTYTHAGYNDPPIPKDAPVQFLCEYTNFYGRYIKVKFNAIVYYLKPSELYKRTKYITILDEPVTGCYAKHKKLGTLGLAARIMTDPETTSEEYWLAIDADSRLVTIALKDCTQLYSLDKVEDDVVTYYG
jgi:hypothetical protein